MTDKTLDVCQCHEKHAPTYWKGVVREYKDALEKAEYERDEARANAYNWEATAGEWEKRALAADPRPLAPDAITDEMVERGRTAYPHGSDDLIRAILTAALTPPARPAGAEEIEAYMREIVASHPEDHYGELADHLASRGVLPPITDKTNPEKEMNR